MQITPVNPFDRVPLSLILDDSAPCVNLTYHWIRQRHAWKARHQPGVPPERYEGDPAKLASVVPAIPADFAREFGEWCGKHGVKGKFSLIPFPACVGRIDRRIPGHSAAELAGWLDAARDVIALNFDLTPEMLSHSFVVDLKTWKPTEDWEQYEWVNPVPEDLLTEYIATALQLLRNVGVTAQGVTSPGGFGGKMEERYAHATLVACREVNGAALPFYFKNVVTDRLPDMPVRYADRERGSAVVSIVACTGDWFGGWTGYDLGHPDRCITADLQGGRVPEVIDAGVPCIFCAHWPGFYYNGDRSGFHIFQEVKRRLDARDPHGERTLWMTNSEIARHYAANAMVRFGQADQTQPGRLRLTVDSAVESPTFTIRLHGITAKAVSVDGKRLRLARSRRHFTAGTYLRDGKDILVAWPLQRGVAELTVERR